MPLKHYVGRLNPVKARHESRRSSTFNHAHELRPFEWEAHTHTHMYVQYVVQNSSELMTKDFLALYSSNTLINQPQYKNIVQTWTLMYIEKSPVGDSIPTQHPPRFPSTSLCFYPVFSFSDQISLCWGEN